MKLLHSIILLACVQVGLSIINFNNPKCNANNCARAVTGTLDDKLPAVTSREDDCSTLLEVTRTPPTITSTTTVTATSTVTGMTVSKRNGELVLRTTFETPSTVPTYASVCPNTSAYLSACSCWGISPITIVLPTPTTVTTTTSTTTVTSTAFSTP